MRPNSWCLSRPANRPVSIGHERHKQADGALAAASFLVSLCLLVAILFFAFLWPF